MHNVYYVRHSRMRCSAHSPLFVCDGQRMSFQKFDSLRYSVNKFSAGCTVHWTTRAKQSHMNEGSGRHTICCDTYLLTPWCRVLPEQLTGLQLVKKLPAFHGTRRFITALTSVRHLSLSWASPIQSTYPHPTSWSSILILTTHLRLYFIIL